MNLGEPVPQRAKRTPSMVAIHHVEQLGDKDGKRAQTHTVASSSKLKAPQKNGPLTRKGSIVEGVLRDMERSSSMRGRRSSTDSISGRSEGAGSGGGYDTPMVSALGGVGEGGGATSTSSVTKWNFEKSNITLEDLQQLKEVFDKAAESCDGKLSEKDFLEAFAPILGASMTPEQLSLWFTHIDASDDQSVEWEEFSTFLLGKGDNADDDGRGGLHGGEDSVFVKDPKTLSVPPTESSATSVSGYNHSEIITSTVTHPRLNKYYTGSQDGTVRVWEGNSLEFQAILHNTKAWVTSVCLGRHDSKLCVSSVDRVVTVYDAHTEKLSKCFVGNTTAVSKYSVSTNKSVTREEIDFRNLSYARSRRGGKGFSDKQDKNFQEQQEKLRLQHQLGQHHTDMYILKEMDYPAMCMMSPTHLPECVYLGLSNGSVQCYKMLASHTPDLLSPIFNTERFSRDSKWDHCNGSDGKKSKLHKGPITSMQCTNKPDTFITTGSDGFIRSVNMEKQKISTIGDKYCEDRGYLRSSHAPPIHSSAWIDSLRTLATSGTERHVSLWSPNSHGPPMALKGHLASVSHVHVVDDDNYLVSIDVDKCIKVWDLRTLRPVQTTVDYDVYRPSNKITSLTYDTKRRQLVTACAAPVVWPLSKVLAAYPDPKYRGHQRAVISVCFNPRFHKLATADADCVRLWAIDTGELLGVWTVESLRSSTSVRTDDDAEAHYIFEMIFAANYKRLIVGLSSGSVFIINFASGQLLTEMLPMRPGVVRKEISFAECTDLEHFNSGGDLHVACLRGHDILVWKDGENADEKRLDFSVKINLEMKTYNRLKWVEEEELITTWRTPLPLCICGMGETHFLVGTDSALILVYNSITWELVSIFGQYEPAINIMCIGYNEKKDLVISGRSDGRINVNSFNFKDRAGSILLRDTHSRSPILQTLDIGELGELVVAGDEEGYVYVCNIASFYIADLPPFTTIAATLDEPAAGIECICYYQAHNTEILRIQLVMWNGTRYVATSASDCQSRLFTAEGEFIGYLGSDQQWDLIRPKPQNYLRTIPAPVVPDHWSSIPSAKHRVTEKSTVHNVDLLSLTEKSIGDYVESGPNTPTLDVSSGVTAASFLPSSSQFTLRGKEAREVRAQLLLESTVNSPLLPKTTTHGSGGSPPSSPTSKGKHVPAPPSPSKKQRHHNHEELPPSLSPPKSRAQLLKQNPRFAAPSRAIAADGTSSQVVGKCGRSTLGNTTVSYKAAPMQSAFSQTMGRTIEHQKVRLTKGNRHHRNPQGEESVFFQNPVGDRQPSLTSDSEGGVVVKLPPIHGDGTQNNVPPLVIGGAGSSKGPGQTSTQLLTSPGRARGVSAFRDSAGQPQYGGASVGSLGHLPNLDLGSRGGAGGGKSGGFTSAMITSTTSAAAPRKSVEHHQKSSAHSPLSGINVTLSGDDVPLATVASSGTAATTSSSGAQTARESAAAIRERKESLEMMDGGTGTRGGGTGGGISNNTAKDPTDVSAIMLEGRAGLFIYKDFKGVALETKKVKDRAKKAEEARRASSKNKSEGSSQYNRARRGSSVDASTKGGGLGAARPGTPIDTKVEMWKQSVAQKSGNSSQAMSAIMFTKLNVPIPDDEAREDISMRRHKMPTQLLLENDPLLLEMRRRPPVTGVSQSNAPAGTLTARTARF